LTISNLPSYLPPNQQFSILVSGYFNPRAIQFIDQINLSLVLGNGIIDANSIVPGISNFVVNICSPILKYSLTLQNSMLNMVTSYQFQMSVQSNIQIQDSLNLTFPAELVILPSSKNIVPIMNLPLNLVSQVSFNSALGQYVVQIIFTSSISTNTTIVFNVTNVQNSNV